MNNKPEKLYLDLIKKTLTYMLWPEPPQQIENSTNSLMPFKEKVLVVLLKLLSTFNKDLKVVKEIKISKEMQENGKLWPAYAETMIGLKRLDNLQYCIEKVIEDKIEGDLIETGVWRGGACIFMRAVLAAYGIKNRRVFVADSFRGLPKPDPLRYPADKGDWLYSAPYLRVSKNEVMNNFKKYDLLDEQVVFLEGWFKDTLQDKNIEKLALIRLDGDMYSSTIEVLNSLYPKLSIGGFCVIDDYGCLETCRKAVDDYRRKYDITADLITIDWTGRYWRKE